MRVEVGIDKTRIQRRPFPSRLVREARDKSMGFGGKQSEPYSFPAVYSRCGQPRLKLRQTLRDAGQRMSSILPKGYSIWP
jgi:hypothetical protein